VIEDEGFAGLGLVADFDVAEGLNLRDFLWRKRSSILAHQEARENDYTLKFDGKSRKRVSGLTLRLAYF
jgi:hypothetical protein